MKLTKKLEAEIKLLMEDYWDSYLNGDLKHWASYLVEDYQNIGTTEAEIWKSKKEIYDYSISVLDQMVGFTELRNKKTEIIPYDPYIMVHEFLDLYIKVEKKWIFYSKLRLSSLIQKIDKAWKIIHQHGSYPDSKVTEGEFFAFDTLKSENLKLQKAIKKRTLELEKTNRELEIETALEKVRSSALAMKDPADMVDVCNVISDQLQLLGVKDIRNVQTAIINEQKGTYLNYQYFAAYQKEVIEETDYNKHPTSLAMVQEMIKSANSTFSGSMEGRELNNFREWRKQNHQFPDPILDELDTAFYYFYSIGLGGLGLTTYKPLSKEELEIFKRFHNVFTLAYSRFVDIEKAIAQAREAKIEAALERVRSLSMAMQKSDELSNTASLMFKEIVELGVNLWSCGFNIIDHEKKIITQWVSSGDGRILPPFETPVTDDIFVRFYEGSKSDKSLYIEEMGGKHLVDHYKYMTSLPQVQDIVNELDSAGIELPKFQVMHAAYFQQGYLLFITYKAVPDFHIIFERFAKVFEQTYTRFLDLQKAEAQSREAQVEAALERVRSLALGMRKSEEVGNVTDRLFTELVNLSIDVNGASIVVIDEDTDKMELWRARSNFAVKPFESASFTELMDLLKKNVPDWFPTFKKALGKRKKYLIDEWSSDRRLQFINAIADQYKYSEEEKSQLLNNAPINITTHFIFFKLGYLALLAEKKLSTEDLSITRRFVEVFDFSYTRFLDIKNAEAQAREAQIEAGLERARAQSMMMQHSEELNKTSQVFHEQLRILGIDSEFSYLWLPNEVKNEHLFWATWQEGADGFKNKQVIYPLDKSEPAIAECYVAWESGMPVHVNPVPPTGVETYFNTWSELLEGVDKFKPELYPDGLYYVDAYMKYGCFGIMIRKQLSEDEQQVLHRFSREFERAYTRFLDLKKAEKQAREAQIEAALEKVRGRSLAMQSTNDLVDVVKVIVEKLQELNVVLDANGVVLCTYFQDSKDVLHWIASPDFSFVGSYLLPYFDHPIFNDAWKSKESGAEYFSKEYPVEEKNNFFEYAFEYSDYKKFPEDFKEWIFQNNRHILSFAWQKNSAILIPSHTGVVPSQDEVLILKRFAKVFEQSYVRFLDLKKAEAQARQANIEIALERIRARAMAMQKPDELTEVAEILRKEMGLLGVEELETSSIYIHDEDSKMTECWYAIKDIREKDTELIPDHMIIDLKETWVGKRMLKYFRSAELKTSIVMKGNNRKEWINYCAERSEIFNGYTGDVIPERTYHLIKFSNGYIGAASPGDISQESWSILERVTKVFALAYTRFRDLKLAEAQAREAQIELALERIRAQVTAMLESSELLDIVVTMRTEFVSLGHEAHYFWHMRYLPEKYEKAMTSGDGARIGMIMSLPRHIHGDIKLLADWEKSDEPTVVFAMDVETAVDYVDKMISLGDFQQVDPHAPTLDDIRHIGGLTFIMARTTHGEIGYSLPGVVPDPPAEDLAIIVRFAGVFDLAYKRFEDLRSSEQRNREAQIELALERVRARTMAMQKSNELAQTSSHIFFQLNELEIKPFRCNIAIVDEELNNCRLWSTTNSGNVIPSVSALPLDEFPVLKEMYNGWKTQRTNHTIRLIGKLRLEWTKYISKYLPFEEYKQNKIDESIFLKEPAYLSNLYFKQGFFTIHTREELTADELVILQRFAHVFEQTYTRYLDLENVERQNKIIQTENQRKTQELEEARELQLAMLPIDLPNLPNFDIAVYMQTATEVGGDYYDFNVEDDGTLTAVIGDATGHGMKAGTIVTITKSLFNSLASEKNILEIFHKISKVIKDMKFRQLSMCLMLVKIEDNILTVSSAAMPPALIYRKSKNTVDEFELRGMPLGAIKNFPYKTVETKLHPGDTILLMSDGLPELLNDKKHMYGYDRIKTEFCSIGEKKSEEIIEHLKNVASKWNNGKDPDDDVTFVVIKMK